VNRKVFALVVLLWGTAVFAFPLWVNRYNGPANSDEMVCAVLTDAGRNVIVVGSSPGTTTAYDIVVIKYAPNGDSILTRSIASSIYSNYNANPAAVHAIS